MSLQNSATGHGDLMIWYRVLDDGACDGEGPTTKLAPVMLWHVDRAKTAAGGAKTLTTGEIVGLPII